MSQKPLSTLTSKTLRRYVCAAVLACAVIGCQQRDAQNKSNDREAKGDAPTQSQTESDDTLTFADRAWTLAGPCQSTGDMFRPSMSATYYTTTDDSIRLIELVVVDESSPLKEGVFSRILGVQLNQNGRWISHGSRAEWDLDGGRGEMQYVQGEPHGMQRNWHPNGRLHIERQLANGKMHGRDRGWWPNGKPQYDSQNINGEEVSGKAWDENGQPL